MPTYDFSCNGPKAHCFEQFLTFAEYDASKGQIKCKECDHPAFIVINDAPHGNVVNRNTFGKQAEINSQKLGKYGVEDKVIADAKKRKPLKKRKDNWWGQLNKPMANKLLNEPDAKKKQEKITKYVNTGEL